MGKDFIDEFIPSKDTRAYLHSIHYEFTDLEKATIVANHIMISYEEAQEKLDETTNMLNMINKIELYSLLMKIKYSDNREKIIDETLKVTRFLLTNVMDVKEESLNEIDECFSK